MLRCLRFPVLLWAGLLCLAGAPSLSAAAPRAALLPDQVSGFSKTASKPAPTPDQALWQEYGLDGSEQAEYAAGDRRFTLTAYRMIDSTGAFAVFQWQRPAGGTPSKLGETALETPDGAVLAYGNYFLRFSGWKPQAPDLAQMTDLLPKFEKSSLPVLPTYLPSEHLVAGSERYVLGPVGLAQFGPGIPPSVAAFHMGAEAQLGKYQTAAGEMELALFSYPTPHIARDQLPIFQKLPGAMAKRTGSFVAVVLSPPSRDDAERLLGTIRYQAEITLTERMPTRRDNIGDLIINIFLLIGVLLIFCAAAGVAYGGFRQLSRRLGGTGGDDPMIVLHLEK